jgi:hypothetical protein
MTLPTKHAAHDKTLSLTGKGFGRLPAIDFRDRGYMLERPTKAPTRTSRYWRVGQVLDQGDTPQCVAFAGEGFLMDAPVKNKPWKTPQDLYNECQKVDEWKDQPHEGTSVRALFKVLQAKGFVSVYNWATDVDTAIAFVLEHGPVVFGTDWYSGMSVPDSHGFIHVAGSIAGGHGYDIIGGSLKKKCPDGSLGAFRMQNSWGTDWGREKGRAWISFPDAAKLIAAWGEVATSNEIKVEEREAEDSEQEPPADARQTSIPAA